MEKKNRNTFPIGMTQRIINENTWLDKGNDIYNNEWNKKKYITLFGRELKFFDSSVVIKQNLQEDAKLGF